MALMFLPIVFEAFLNYCTYYSTSITQPKACCIHMCYLLAVHLLLYFCLQPLAIFQRSLTTMQIQIQGLLQFAVPLFPTAEVWHTETLLWCSLRKKNKGWSVFQWYADLSTERSPGYTTFAQLLGGQSAPADRPAGLQGAQQGLFTAS